MRKGNREGGEQYNETFVQVIYANKNAKEDHIESHFLKETTVSGFEW